MTISLVRNYHFSDLVENFIFSSVVSILGIRIFLHLTGYPQMGGSHGLHIAHMLWGGLFMLITIILFLALLNRGAMIWGSLLGGIGFGFFIDEIGKYITTDNNYFFKPTFALIYGIFVLIYLSARLIERFPAHEKENIVNALESIKQCYISGFTENDKTRINLLLSAETGDKNLDLIKRLVNSSETSDPKSHPFVRIKNYLYNKYKLLISKRFFQNILLTIFTTYIFIELLSLMDLIFDQKQRFDTPYLIFTNALAVILVIVGGYFMIFKKNRLKTYNLFRYSILIVIFFNQFSFFYRDQLSAIIYLFFELTLYLVLRYLIQQEEKVQGLSS